MKRNPNRGDGMSKCLQASLSAREESSVTGVFRVADVWPFIRAD